MIEKKTPSDILKELGDWSLAAGRFFQSPQTGYVHLYYGEKEQKAQTIPLVENALFSLALLRSRLMEQVQEAKGLLKRLLVFQNHCINDEEYGNFPVYLHAYPICQDSTIGVQLLASFYWILKQFGQVLGTELKLQLEQAAQLTLQYSLRIHQLKPLSYSFAVRLAAAQLAYGMLWKDSAWQQRGKEQLEHLAQRQLEGWQTTKHLADILVGLQMVYPSLSQSPWNLLWQQMKETWHPHLACYMGPCVRERQEREEPQVNLYDLFGGAFNGQFARRAILLNPCHLHAVLIQTSDSFHWDSSSFAAQGVLKQQAWRVVCYPACAYTLLEKKEPYQPHLDKTHTPFRFIWGNLHSLHSLVCQGGNLTSVEYEEKEHTLFLLCHLRDQLVEEDNNPKREVEFFVDFHPDVRFYLNEHVANTFELGQKIQILLGKYELSLTFDLIEGKGDFLGHVMRGNRPSQVAQKGENRFQTYDWILFLRTIRREQHCQMRITVTFSQLNDSLF